MTPPAQESRYSTPEAMARGLTDHLRRQAKQRGLAHSNLHRQFAYDRLLARVFADDQEEWVLKGGTALLARVRSARHTRDIDLSRRSGTVTEAVEELKELVRHDLGDHFRFEFGRTTVRTERAGQPDTELAGVSVIAYVGTAVFETFSIDVVTGSVMTTAPETRTPSVVVEFDGLLTPVYRLYPIVDHIADKLCATVETHGETGKPSSRVRDLVDIVVLARTQTVDARMLKDAIEAERQHRGLPAIRAFAVPREWANTYSKEARAVVECEGYRTLADAVALVGRFLDPVLAVDTPSGRWSPRHLAWA